MANIRTFIGLVAMGMAVTVTAMPWDGANPTTSATDTLGWTPLPTEAPFPLYGAEMVPMPGKRIFARAFADQSCGAISGDPGEAMVPLLSTPSVN